MKHMIIDTHAHIGRMIGFNMTEEQLLYSMEKYGIDFSLVSNIEAAECAHNGMTIPRILQKSQLRVLKSTLDIARRNPDKIGAVIWIKLMKLDLNEEFLRVFDENRELIYGIKLHPFHSRTAPDDSKLAPVYELARKYSLPVVSHTGGCEEARSVHLYNAAKENPDINFVMVHMDLGTDHMEAVDLMCRLPNLYGDTTWVDTAATLEAVRRAGSEKILFGTDNPIDGRDTLLHNKTGDRSLYQEYFNEFRGQVSEEDYANIMYKNAQRIFLRRSK